MPELSTKRSQTQWETKDILELVALVLALPATVIAFATIMHFLQKRRLHAAKGTISDTNPVP